jgi:Type I site-specific restriction-modification system, R (restriction) subunit and related helicases
MTQSEQDARRTIDALLEAAGWSVQVASAANIFAARGVAIREFPLPGHDFADYLLYVDGAAAGVLEAKKAGSTLSGVETQSDKYTKGLTESFPRWGTPLPFSYQSTGIETRFTNGPDPTPRARGVFAFHRPEHLADLLGSGGAAGRAADATIPQVELRLTVSENVASQLEASFERVDRLRQSVLAAAFSGRLLDADQARGELSEDIAQLEMVADQTAEYRDTP